MKRLVLTLSATLLLSGMAVAQDELPDPLADAAVEADTPETAAQVETAAPVGPAEPETLAAPEAETPEPLVPSTGTEPMQPEVRPALPTPAQLVHARAAAKAQNRRHRMAVRKYYGHSLSRPNLGQPIYVRSYGWGFTHQPYIVVPRTRPNITQHDLRRLVR